MLDIEGNELEVGVIYVIPGSTSRMVVGRFSHETASSFIFEPARIGNNCSIRDASLYSWKRQIPKWTAGNSIAVIRASQALIDRYAIK